MTHFLDLVIITSVCARPVVSQGFRSGELVVARRCYHDVALACDLSGKPCDWPCYLIDLREHYDTWEPSLGIVWYCGMVDKDAYTYSVTIIGPTVPKNERMLPVSACTSCCDSVISIVNRSSCRKMKLTNLKGKIHSRNWWGRIFQGPTFPSLLVLKADGRICILPCYLEHIL